MLPRGVGGWQAPGCVLLTVADPRIRPRGHPRVLLGPRGQQDTGLCAVGTGHFPRRRPDSRVGGRLSPPTIPSCQTLGRGLSPLCFFLTAVFKWDGRAAGPLPWPASLLSPQPMQGDRCLHLTSPP